MAQLSSQCEFMNNAFPAIKAKFNDDFALATDKNGEPMIFFVNDKGTLGVILKGQSGNNEFINLKDRFGISSADKVGPFAMSQTLDSNIHLAYTVLQADGIHKLCVMKPREATREAWHKPFDQAQDFYKGTLAPVSIKSVFMAESVGATYPNIYLSLSERSKQTVDIWIITVNNEGGTWERDKLFELPRNTDKIIAKAVATINDYTGLFMIEQQDAAGGRSDPELKFVGYNAHRILEHTKQKMPEGASCISSFVNSEANTDFIVSGSRGLYWCQAEGVIVGYNKEKDPMKLISSESGMCNLVQMHIAQTSNSFAVWGLGKDSLLSYQEWSINSDGAPTLRTPAIPLLDRKTNGKHFAALQHARLGQTVFVLDGNGDMSMLEQSNQTALWQTPVKVVIPDSGEMIEFKSYTIQVQAIDSATGMPLKNHPFRICASDTSEMIIHGKSIRGSFAGHLGSTDDSGILTVIVQSDGVDAPTITIRDADGTKFGLKEPFVINPLSKLFSSIGNIQSASDLKNQKLPDGTALVKAGVGDDDLTKTVEALQQLAKVRNDMSSGGTVRSASYEAESDFYAMNVLDRIWGAIKYCVDKIKEGAKWALNKVGEAWQFVVNIAGKAWNFVLETAAHIANAMKAVMDTIGEGWKWLKSKFEWIFMWEDFIEVKNVYVNLTTQALLWGVDAVGNVQQQVDGYFNNVRGSIRALKGEELPGELKKLKAGNDSTAKREADKSKFSSDAKEGRQSPAASFAHYHLKHSGDPTLSGNTVVDRLMDRIKKIVDSISGLMQRLVDNVKDLVKDTDFSIEKVLKNMGVDLLEDVVNVIQQITTALLGSFADLILLLTDSINTEIQIPILSPLYSRYTNGSKLTILDVVCLCFAIPTTFMYKLVTGKRPREIPDIQPLLKADIHKKDLDRRMGRIRTKADAASAMSAHATSDQSSSDLADPDDVETLGLDDVNVDLALAFARTMRTVGPLIKIGMPFGMVMWFRFYTLPKCFEEGESSMGRRVLSTTCYGLIWLGQFASITDFSVKAVEDGTFSLAKLAREDPLFAANFRIWLVGGITVFSSMAQRDMGYILQTAVAWAQAGLMAHMHIYAWTVGPGYSAYLATEEWAKVFAKISVGFTGLTRGGYGYGALNSTLVHTIAFVLNVARVPGEELDPKKKKGCSGMEFC